MFADIQKTVADGIVSVYPASVVLRGGKVMHSFCCGLHCCAPAGAVQLCSCAKISNLAAEKIFLIQQADLSKKGGADKADCAGNIVNIVEPVRLQGLLVMREIMATYVSAACIQNRAAKTVADERADNSELRLGLHGLRQEQKILFLYSGIVVQQEDEFASCASRSANAGIVAARIAEILVIPDKNNIPAGLPEPSLVRRIRLVVHKIHACFRREKDLRVPDTADRVLGGIPVKNNDAGSLHSFSAGRQTDNLACLMRFELNMTAALRKAYSATNIFFFLGFHFCPYPIIVGNIVVVRGLIAENILLHYFQYSVLFDSEILSWRTLLRATM